MDIMDKVNDLVEAITKNEKLMEQFKKDPAKVVKGLLDKTELDDMLVEKLVQAIKAKIDIDKAANLLGGLKKLF